MTVKGPEWNAVIRPVSQDHDATETMALSIDSKIFDNAGERAKNHRAGRQKNVNRMMNFSRVLGVRCAGVIVDATILGIAPDADKRCHARELRAPPMRQVLIAVAAGMFEITGRQARIENRYVRVVQGRLNDWTKTVVVEVEPSRQRTDIVMGWQAAFDTAQHLVDESDSDWFHGRAGAGRGEALFSIIGVLAPRQIARHRA